MSSTPPLRSASRSLLTAIALAVFGNGLLSTVAALRLADASAGEALSGLILSAYFAGIVVGSLTVGPTIHRIGSVRAFTTFTALAVVATLLHGIVPPGLAWIVLRAATGFAMAGFYVTVEGWLTASADATSRGRVLSIYLVTLYLGLSLGQFVLPLLPRADLDPISVSALVAGVAAMIVSLTTTHEPAIPSPEGLPAREVFRVAPIGWLGAVISGFVIGTIYTSFPLMLREAGRSESETTFLLGAALMGGLVGQRPIGTLSDRGDRRVVLLGVALVLALLCALAPTAESTHVVLLALHTVLFGALAFTLYPLAVAHALDRTPGDRGLGVVAHLILISAIGSTVGPIVASPLSAAIGSRGLFLANGLGLLTLAGVGAWRILRVDPVEQEAFRAMPRTSPIVGEMDPRIPTEPD